jgi:hypothetical protein
LIVALASPVTVRSTWTVRPDAAGDADDDGVEAAADPGVALDPPLLPHPATASAVAATRVTARIVCIVGPLLGSPALGSERYGPAVNAR